MKRLLCLQWVETFQELGTHTYETSLRLETETDRVLELDVVFRITVASVGTTCNKVTHYVFKEWFVTGGETIVFTLMIVGDEAMLICLLLHLFLLVL